MGEKELLFEASILIDDLLKIHSPELFNDSDVKAAQERMFYGGGMLHRSAVVQNEIKNYFTGGT